MYLEELVETAIGLILVYIVMSLAVLQIQEWIAGMLDKRAKHLEEIVRKMLAEKVFESKPAEAATDSTVKLAKTPTIFSRLYNHPLIRSLYQKGKRPSYIPAKNFALALFDAVMTAGTDLSTIQNTLTELKTSLPETVLTEVKTGLNKLIDDSKLVKNTAAELAHFNEKIYAFAAQYPELNIVGIFEALLQARLPTKESEILARLKLGAANLIVYNPELRQTMDSLIMQAETYVEKGESILATARLNAENWFNDTMDRASGWYKRNAQKWAFGLGLGLALFFNVDTIHIATELWRQPLLRQSVAAAAEDFQLPQRDLSSDEDVASAQEAIRQLRTTLSGLNIPLGWTLEPLGPALYNPAVNRCTPFPKEDGIDVSGLPINGQCKVWTNPPKGWGILTKLIGLLITGLATVQGAPFWFQILEKIINVRSTGTKPGEKEQGKAQEKGQKK